MSEKPKYTIEVIKQEDRAEVYELLKLFFTKDEPCCNSMGLLHCEDIENYLMKSIPDNCSYKAVNEKGEIIGAVMNAIGRRPPPGVPQQKAADVTKDEKWKKLCILMDNVEEHYNIFDAYPDSHVFLDGKAVAVNPKYRGLGIAGDLIQKSCDFIRENNISAMRRICTSAFSARVMEKLNMKEVFKVVYADFKVNGVQLLKPASPHIACRVFIMEK